MEVGDIFFDRLILLLGLERILEKTLSRSCEIFLCKRTLALFVEVGFMFVGCVFNCV